MNTDLRPSKTAKNSIWRNMMTCTCWSVLGLAHQSRSELQDWAAAQGRMESLNPKEAPRLKEQHILEDRFVIYISFISVCPVHKMLNKVWDSCCIQFQDRFKSVHNNKPKQNRPTTGFLITDIWFWNSSKRLFHLLDINCQVWKSSA